MTCPYAATVMQPLMQRPTVLHCDNGFALSHANMPLSKHGTVAALFS